MRELMTSRSFWVMLVIMGPLVGVSFTSFEVHGPFKISYEKHPDGRTLVFDDFWPKEVDANYLADARGCYVFAIRNRGLTPIYVGQATKSFKQEIFNVT